jgi:hypothetical protein
MKNAAASRVFTCAISGGSATLPPAVCSVSAIADAGSNASCSVTCDTAKYVRAPCRFRFFAQYPVRAVADMCGNAAQERGVPLPAFAVPACLPAQTDSRLVRLHLYAAGCTADLRLLLLVRRLIRRLRGRLVFRIVVAVRLVRLRQRLLRACLRT